MVAASTPTEALTFGYDADGVRTAKSVNGLPQRFVVAKNRYYAQVLEERSAGGALDVAYIHGDDLISQDRGGSLSFYHTDGQLSTRQLTDGAANVTDSYTYDAFGVTLASNGTTPNNYLYTGEQFDPNVGFYYLRARFYEQRVGRFVSQDSFPGGDQDPITLHKYLYASATPTNMWDPSGLVSVASVSISVGVISTIASIAITGLSFLVSAFGYKSLSQHLEGVARVFNGIAFIACAIAFPHPAFSILAVLAGIDELVAGVEQTLYGRSPQSPLEEFLTWIGLSRGAAGVTSGIGKALISIGPNTLGLIRQIWGAAKQASGQAGLWQTLKNMYFAPSNCRS